MFRYYLIYSKYLKLKKQLSTENQLPQHRADKSNQNKELSHNSSLDILKQ